MTSLPYEKLIIADQDAMINSVRKYYEYVDERSFEKFTDVFTEDIIYNRCGVIFSGFYNLIHFYNKDRGLKGRHIIKKAIQQHENVVIHGIFKGKNGKGKTIEIDFTDLFKLRENNLAYQRESYFHACTEDVQSITIPNDVGQLSTTTLLDLYDKRKKLRGSYQILEKIQQGDSVAIKGIFTEKEAIEKPTEKNFLDLFQINKNNQISSWETYLASGYERSI